MTTQELMEQVFREAGEPTDLCPYTTPGDETTFDITIPGAVKLLIYINTGLTRIANWVFPDGRSMRFKNLIARSYFQSNAPVVDTVLSATDTTITIPGLSTNVADQYRGWIIRITAGTGSGQSRFVLSNTVAVGGEIVCSVNTAWETNPDATSEVELFKSFFQFVGAGVFPYEDYHIKIDSTSSLLDVMRIRDIDLQTDMTPTERTDIFTAGLLQPGVPTLYRVMGNAVYFDVPVAEQRTFEIVYLRHPVRLTAEIQVPELPVHFHECISLWAVHNIQRLNHDYDGAYATKRELQELMQTLRLQGYNDMELENGGVTVFD